MVGSGGSLTGTLTGGGGAGIKDTLRQTDGTNTWNITAGNAGDATDVAAFTEIENLTGGSGEDTFAFAAGTNVLSGNIDGGAGNDKITRPTTRIRGTLMAPTVAG